MRILAVGLRVYLGDMFLSLQRAGHEVRVFAADPPELRAFGGILETVADWRDHLDWARGGIVVFEGTGHGGTQDDLRARGFAVIGGSAFGDRLEDDRDFGQAVLRQAGMAIADSRAFASPREAQDWLRRNPGRYVLKHDNSAHATFVGEHPDGADVAFRLARVSSGRVLLMARLDGVEVGVGAYFDGAAFLRPACIDFEHKRFFPGDMGEMTGEMGTLAAYDGSDRLFEATLDRIAPALAAAGHVGYVNLNMMVDARGIWPLEFTCRFGNPGFAILAAMQPDGWGDLFRRMIERDRQPRRFRTDPGWSVAIVLTIPPFPAWNVPCVPDDDPPVFFRVEPEGAEAAHYHLVDVRREAGQLRGHKRSGHVMIVTGNGATVGAARKTAADRANNVVCPELRYRTDIGQRFLDGEGALLRARGLLPRDLAW